MSDSMNEKNRDEKPQKHKNRERDVVLSTRLRFARNLREFPFSARLQEAQRQEIYERICEAIPVNVGSLQGKEMTQYSALEAQSLAERRVISTEFAKQLPGTALLLEPEHAVSVMVCEEDHLRIQGMQEGLCLEETHRNTRAAEALLGERLEFAFDERLGYLTQCPTNLGTAMRASVLLHLPALSALGRTARLGESIAKLGLTCRGAYGEGTEARGALFQFSNQVTLGITEEQALENLQTITTQILDQERRAAESLLAQPQWEDRVWRAYGILTNARRIDCEECMKLLSLVHMGAAREVLPVKATRLSDLMIEIQPATLMLARALTAPEERDSARAELVRCALAK